jgi:hypothetical protein
MAIERGEQLKVRVSSEEKALLEAVATSQGFSTMSAWLRARLYDEGWRLVFKGADVLRQLQGGLDLELLLQRLRGGRWFDAELVRGLDSPEGAVERFWSERVPEQVAVLAGLPLAGDVDVDQVVEVLERVSEVSEDD